MKICIITLLHNNINYGGQLQAYALQKYIQTLGYVCDQILIENDPILHVGKYEDNKTLYELYTEKVKHKLGKLLFKNQFKIRKNAVLSFTKKYITTSQKIRNVDNITEIINLYDVFICGSDQIWNPMWLTKKMLNVYTLGFVEKKFNCISYSASFGLNNILEEDLEFICERIKNFRAISVRETIGKEILNKKINSEISVVVDPVLLLDQDFWDGLLEKPKVKEKYLFCYFLGEGKLSRKIANIIAKKYNWKIISLPHFPSNIKISDIFFGNAQFYDITAIDFLNLIRNAEMILTDSFHATAFSIIFEKKFWVFRRSKKDTISSRITNILALTSLGDRYVHNDTHQVYKNSVWDKAVNYENGKSTLNNARLHSQAFLKDALGGTKNE